MNNDAPIARIDEILAPWKAVIAEDYAAYRNHVCRMLTFCCDLQACTDEQKHKLAIAAAFHDIGIWTAHTLDYLPPSVVAAREYLASINKSEWEEEISLMIIEHHRLRPIRQAPSSLVELFRRGDLVDFSRGLLSAGLPRSRIQSVQEAFPNAGFHKRLVQLAWQWFKQHPLNPAPMMKW